MICFFISIQCQGWLLGRSGSEALGSEALISQSTGLGRIEAIWLMVSDALRVQRRWAGIRGKEALAKDALVKEALARKPLVRKSPTTGLASMEAEFVRHSRYSLRSKASSFFLLALLIRLSGKLHDLNYNNCLLERFPTHYFLC